MVICGIKLTHDAAIALIDDKQLVFSYEMEKFSNNSRHCNFTLNMSDVDAVLTKHGYSLASLDRLVFDGWGETWNFPEIEDRHFSVLTHFNGQEPRKIMVSRYGHVLKGDNVLDSDDFTLDEGGLRYRSYMHVSGHIFSAYCSSPFAKARSSSFILIWDGLMPPQLFYHNFRSRRTSNLGILFPILGSIYALFPHEYEPFNEEPLSHSIPGKAMAYVAVGKPIPQVRTALDRILNEAINETCHFPLSPLVVAIITKTFVTRAKAYGDKEHISAADMIASCHYFLQDLLVKSLAERVKQIAPEDNNLCFAGGCALNIKWNTALRDSGLFNHVWVPPFPNDSGSAIGAACCEMVKNGNNEVLEWNVYAGQSLGSIASPNSGWSVVPCTLKQLATLLHQTGEPVVFLNGRAELGPRALGNRSILAAPSCRKMKRILNELKLREDYRPVAPVCLEEDAPEIFAPGSPDAYMLFEHKVRRSWLDKIPAVCHLDGTARLQTVTMKQNPELYELLTWYRAVSGMSVLCNTSANQKGKGFFPDLDSAMRWGKISYVWNKDRLYSRV